jgi:ferric-dicitrate binding protein FerR (iron transport regulator)
MRAVGIALLLTFAASTTLAGPASEPQASRMMGDVFYRSPGGTTQRSIYGSIVLEPDSFISTGQKSLAQIRYPDSSLVEIGSNSVVQVGAFHSDWHDANILALKNGAIHLNVRHNDHPTNYEFVTPLFKVAVRGTEATITTTESDGSVTCQEGNLAVVFRDHETNIARGQTLTVGRSGENGFLEKLTGP